MPEIVYESDLCTFYLGDCLEVLPTLDPADLLVTDPPYGIAFNSGRSDNHEQIAGDESTDVALAALAAVRLRRGRHAYVFWSPKVARPDAEALKFQEWTPLVWDKGVIGMGGRGCWSVAHEEILFACRCPSRANRRAGGGKGAARLRRSNVLRVDRLNSRATRRHPTEKPVPLLRDLIESSSRHGEVVIDPFAGVGSTCVAAILEGRRAIGIELGPGYAEIAVERIKRAEEVARSAVGV